MDNVEAWRYRTNIKTDRDNRNAEFYAVRARIRREHRAAGLPQPVIPDMAGYTCQELRELRAANGVGRPPRNKGVVS